MLEWRFVENGLNPPPLRHFVRSPTVLVPSAYCEMSVRVGSRLALDWHRIEGGMWRWIDATACEVVLP